MSMRILMLIRTGNPFLGRHFPWDLPAHLTTFCHCLLNFIALLTMRPYYRCVERPTKPSPTEIEQCFALRLRLELWYCRLFSAALPRQAVAWMRLKGVRHWPQAAPSHSNITDSRYSREQGRCMVGLVGIVSTTGRTHS